jgi:hypothetical protein
MKCANCSGTGDVAGHWCDLCLGTGIDIEPIPPRGDFVEITDRSLTIRETLTADEINARPSLADLVFKDARQPVTERKQLK